jgi:tripartite-type tricarboxylate transporter receptor subunit TctC
MKRTLRVVLAVTLAAIGLQQATAADKAWPSGPVQLVVPAKAGGGTDVMARVFSEYLQREIKSPVVVVNQPAGGGTVAFETVRTAKPDGRTLLFNHTGTLVYFHTGRYDHPVSAFTTIAIMQGYPPQVYAVGAKAPWNTMKDFVEDARRNPGKRVFGVALGGTSHFIAGQVMRSEDVKFKLVESASEVDKVAAIQGGHIDIGNMGAGAARQFVASGKLKVLAMIDEEPNPKFPEFVPAVKQGVKASWFAPLVLWGPPGMDPAVVKAVNAATRNMATDATVRQQLDKMSSTFTYRPVEQAQALIKAEDEKIGALARDLGLARK